MTTLLTSTTKRRRPPAALLARSSAERMFGSWQALQGSETLAPCHAFSGQNFGITKGLDSHYVPTGGSS